MVTATTTILGIPAIPEVVTDDKNLEVTLSAMKEAIEVITGSRGDPNSRAITFGEATENGATDLFITNRVTEAAQNGATSARLSGDIVGTGLFVEGAVVVPTAIQLPNITRVSGGTPSTTYVGDVAGPYGIEGGYPAGGTTGQVLGKVSATDDDVAWITQSGGGGGGGLPTGGAAGQFLIKDSATDGDASWQDWSPGASTDLFAPGYSVTYVSPTSFTVDGFDVTHMFRANRRIKFNGGGVDSYGIIASVSYSSPDTTVTMTMEDSGTVPSTISDYWFSSSSTYWSPIATDPFGGTAINDIATGIIGSTEWWVAVGDAGKIFTSTDKGVTWTARTSGTTDNLYTVGYGGRLETFVVGGSTSNAAGYLLLESTDGVTYTNIGSTTAGGNNNFNVGSDTGDYIYDVTWNRPQSFWVVIQFDASALAYRSYVVFDTWTGESSRVATSTSDMLVSADGTVGATGQGWDYCVNTAAAWYPGFVASGSQGWNLESTSAASGMYACVVTGSQLAQTYIFRGCVNGNIDQRYYNTAGIAYDRTTFSSAINDFAASSADQRVVCVGDLGVVGYFPAVDIGLGSKVWTEISNGFSPSTNINAVAYNETDGVFVAVATNGQICRSSTGAS